LVIDVKIKSISLYFLFFLIFILGTGPTIEAYDLSPPAKSWIEKGCFDGYTTYYRDIKEDGIREVLLKGVLNVPSDKCFEVISDYNSFPENMPYVEFIRVLHSENNSPVKKTHYVFFFVKMPVIAYRFYTAKFTNEQDVNGQKGVFRSKWSLEKGKYRTNIDDPEIQEYIVPGYQPPVEAIENEGYWIFEPIENGKKTLITYYVWLNPGGSVPLSLINQANTIILPKLWRAFKKRLVTLGYLIPPKLSEVELPF
jgi:hypothetical protein